MDYPTEPAMSDEYYNTLKSKLGQELVEKINPILDGLTPDQLRSLSDYINECRRCMCEHFEKNVTMEDYESAKKIDVDSDQEEGEV